MSSCELRIEVLGTFLNITVSSLLNFLSFSLLSHRGLSIKARIGHIKHLSLSTSVHLCVCLPSIIYSDHHYNFAVSCNQCCLLASFSLTTPLLELVRILPQDFRCARKMSQSGDVQVPVVLPPPALRVPDGPESSARRVVVKASDVEAEVGRNAGGSASSREGCAKRESNETSRQKSATLCRKVVMKG